MPQVSLYVDDETMKELRSEAKSEGVSLSKYVALRLRSGGRCNTSSGLPSGYFDSLYGCLSDDDSFVRPAQIDSALDAPRLAFD